MKTHVKAILNNFSLELQKWDRYSLHHMIYWSVSKARSDWMLFARLKSIPRKPCCLKYTDIQCDFLVWIFLFRWIILDPIFYTHDSLGIVLIVFLQWCKKNSNGSIWSKWVRFGSLTNYVGNIFPIIDNLPTGWHWWRN